MAVGSLARFGRVLVWKIGLEKKEALNYCLIRTQLGGTRVAMEWNWTGDGVGVQDVVVVF